MAHKSKIFKVNYDFRKAIRRDGKIVGWRLYKKDGVLFTSRFVGYIWKGR
jgi:hypothetical protein